MKIQNRKELKEYLTYERRKYKLTYKRYIPFLFDETQIIERHNRLLRKSEYYYNINSILKYFYLFRLRMLQNKFCLHIPLNSVGKGLDIAHVGPIIINRNTIIGNDCRIHACVNIGANGGKSPIIGDGVYIGPGVKMFGEIIIANECVIGANAVVNKSYEVEKSVIVGVPSRSI